MAEKTEKIEKTTEKANLTALPGNEKKLNYKIAPVPQDKGRFGFTWDVFVNRFGKMVYVNLLMLIFFTPLITIFMLLRSSQIQYWGSMGAFGNNLGVGYPASPDNVGMAEMLMLEADTIYFALAIALSFITAAGIAGGVYCVRKLLRSDEELRLFKDFFTGIKQGYLSALVACLLSFAMLFVSVRVWDYAAYQIVMGESAALYIFFRVLACVATAIVMLVSLWILSVGSNYKQNAWGLIKNSCSLGFGTIIQSVFFAALPVAPVALFLFSSVSGLGSILYVLGIIYFFLTGFSAALLIWCSFTDWAFDNFADYTAVQTGAQEEERKKATLEEQPEEDIISLLLVGGKNSYLSRAMQSLDEGTAAYSLPYDFTAEDLATLAENKEKIRQESAAFAAEHAEEENYKEYNARFADRDKVLTETDKKGKKKKFAPRMLNQ